MLFSGKALGRGRAPGLLALLWILGCADLQPLARGVCGNGIVERGEDCDSFATGDGTSCGSEGATACRYECSPDGSSDGPACPTGWGCGADAICREPTGEFEGVPLPLAQGGDFLALADFDGDRRKDLFTIDSSLTSIGFYDLDFNLRHTFELPAALSSPTIADLSGDDRADVIFSAGGPQGDLGILLGLPDGTLARHVSPARSVGADASVRFVSLRPWSQPTRLLLVVADAASDYPAGATCAAASCIFVDSPGLQAGALAELAEPVENLAREIVVAEFDEQSGCEQLAVAFGGATQVTVYSPCDFVDPDRPVFTSTVVGLPPGAVVTNADQGPGLLVADVDRDGHADLLIQASPIADSWTPLYVAYGTGDGRFRSVPGGEIDDQAAPLQGLADPGSQPLAVANIDGDDVLDFVSSEGVWLSSSFSSSGACGASFCPPDGVAWDSVMVLDVNGDGHSELVAGSRGRRGFQFFYNTGKRGLTPSSISTEERLTRFASGDFDGDGLLDIAIAGPTLTPGDSGLSDSVSVSFGRTAGPPSEPVSVGRFGEIEQLIETDVESSSTDGMSDLCVLSRSTGDERQVSLLQGSADRQLFAPFGLSGEGLVGLPVSAVVGQFVADPMPDLGVVSFAYSQETNDGRLWLASGLGGGRFEPPLPGAPMPMMPFGAAAAHADLDGDEREELVLLLLNIDGIEVGPVAAADAGVWLFVARVEEGDEGVRWTLDEGQQVSRELPFVTSELAQLRLLDVDGDGWLDLFVPHLPAPQVFWGNEGGSFEVEQPLILELPDEQEVVQSAWVQRNRARRELVLGTTDSLYIVSFDGRQAESAEPLLTDHADVLGPSYRLASGDVNGDGIEDLVSANPDGAWIYAGQAARR